MVAVAEGNKFNAGIREESSYSNGMLPKHYAASDPRAELITLMGGTRTFLGYPCTSDAITWQPNVLDIMQGGMTSFAKAIGGPGSGSLTGFFEHLSDTNGHKLAMEGLFRNSWIDNDNTGLTGNVTVSSNEMTLTGTGFPLYVPNTYVKVTQAGEAANTGVGMVVSSSTTALAIEMKAAPATGTGVTWDIVQQLLYNGNELKSYTLEKTFGDISEHLVFPGGVITGGNLQFNSRSFVQLVTNWTTNKPLASNAATISTNATPYKSNVVTPPFETSNNITAIWQNSELQEAWLVESVNLAFTMAGSGDRAALMYPGPAGVRIGSFGLEVQVQGAFSYPSIYNDLVNGTPGQMAFENLDDNGNGFVIAVPKGMPTAGTPAQGDNQGDSNHPVTIKAYKDSGQSSADLSASLSYFPAA